MEDLAEWATADVPDNKVDWPVGIGDPIVECDNQVIVDVVVLVRTGLAGLGEDVASHRRGLQF
jgi:hypothetical protein